MQEKGWSQKCLSAMPSREPREACPSSAAASAGLPRSATKLRVLSVTPCLLRVATARFITQLCRGTAEVDRKRAWCVHENACRTYT